MIRFAAIGLVTGMVATTTLTGDQRLNVRVFPVVALAPASLTVRAIVEPNEDNRALNIEVSSSDFMRVSEVPLEGKSAPRLNVFELRDLPPGLYEVQATLLGPRGRITAATQLVKVQPAPGHSH